MCWTTKRSIYNREHLEEQTRGTKVDMRRELLDVRGAAGKVLYNWRYFRTSTPMLLGAIWVLRNIYCFLCESKRVGRALGTHKISGRWARERSIAR